jgi:MFS family permease
VNESARGRLGVSPEGRLVLAAKAVRTFGFGWLSVVLAMYLTRRGFSSAEIGGVFTATMIEDALLTMALSAVATRIGPVRVMVLTAPLIAVGGIILALANAKWLLLVGAVLGTLSPTGQEAGPFTAMEQALLPGTVKSGSTTRAFGWYNIFGFLPAGAGALASGLSLHQALAQGMDEDKAYRMLFGAYALMGVALTAIYFHLNRSLSVKTAATRPRPPGAFGLGPSRGPVLQLAALQGLDAFAGGFTMQSLLAYWFLLRFNAGPDAVGWLFFGTNLLSAVSFLMATRLADRFGLLNTMVFTHLPSNVLLLMVPLMPTFATAALVLWTRHLLSQMDVPTRQAYTMALVAPDERPAAAGFTGSVRALAQACAPLVSGLTMATAATGTPFFLSGGLKIVYDIALYFRFRGVALQGDKG